jgi:hypothetical protein
MNAESIKLELMVWIGELTDTSLLEKLYLLKKKDSKSSKQASGSQALLPEGAKQNHALPIVEIQRSGEPVALKFGAGKHLIKYMADDFTAPIEDFKEYM